MAKTAVPLLERSASATLLQLLHRVPCDMAITQHLADFWDLYASLSNMNSCLASHHTHQRAWWLPRAQKGGMAGVPITSWYCLITSSGVGPVKMYRSTRPPITLRYAAVAAAGRVNQTTNHPAAVAAGGAAAANPLLLIPHSTGVFCFTKHVCMLFMRSCPTWSSGSPPCSEMYCMSRSSTLTKRGASQHSIARRAAAYL
jgi:hypothetical protein